MKAQNNPYTESKSNIKHKVKCFNQYFAGELLTLEVEGNDTIRDVKYKICEVKGIHLDCQRLIYAGKQLEDHQTLSGGKVHSASCTLYLATRNISICIKTCIGKKSVEGDILT